MACLGLSRRRLSRRVRNVGIGCDPNYSGPGAFQGSLTEVLFVREPVRGERHRDRC